jgi:hypothetical protein
MRTLNWILSRALCAAILLLSAFSYGQDFQPAPSVSVALPDAPSATLFDQQSGTQSVDSAKQQPNSNLGESAKPQQNSTQTPEQKKQPKRILYIIPNYRAVSSDANLPPLTPGGKFKLMVDDSFDYSAFVYTGLVAGLRFAANSYPELGHGMAGYGQYYWRAFVDQAVGDTFTEWLLPVAFKQDPRYFTQGHGGFFNRTGYAASRLVVTRSDKGTEQFNISELAGNLAAAGISNAYYPAPERGVSNTINNWVIQLALDGGFNVVKEFWPDIQHKILRQKD